MKISHDPSFSYIYQIQYPEREIIKQNEDGSILFYDKKLCMIMRTMNNIERLIGEKNYIISQTCEANTATENSDIIEKDDIPHNIEDFTYRKANILYVVGFEKPNLESFTFGQKLAKRYDASYVSLDLFSKLGYKKAFSDVEVVGKYHQNLIWEYIEKERKSKTFFKGIDPKKNEQVFIEENAKLIRWLKNKHQRMIIEGLILVPVFQKYPELARDQAFLFKGVAGEEPKGGRPSFGDVYRVLFTVYRLYRWYKLYKFILGGSDEETPKEENKEEPKQDELKVAGGENSEMNTITENLLMQEPNVEYRFDMWLEGRCNLLFVTGLSGSGKSTYARALAKKYNCNHVEIDKFGDEVKAKHPEIRQLPQPERFTEIVKYAIEKFQSQRTVIEGAQIAYIDPEIVKPYACIILTTSALISTYRAVRRSFVDTKREAYWAGTDNPVLLFLHALFISAPKLIKWNLKQYSDMEKYKQNFTTEHFVTQPLSESSYLGVELEGVIETNNRYSTRTNIFFSEKDIYCNMDRFKKGEVNIVFVTGFSGSGKSTLARRFAVNTESIYVELDAFIYRGMKRPFTKEWCYENRAEILWMYIEEKKKPLDFMTKYKRSEEPGVMKEVYEYVKWLETKPTYPGKYIIEGVDVTRLVPMDPEWYKYPIIFKGTSAFTSAIRKIRRDGTGINSFSTAIDFIKEMIGWYNDMGAQQDGLRANVIFGDPKQHFEMDDSWVKENTIPVGMSSVLEASNSSKGHLIPVDYSNYNVPGTRVMCLNTHVLNTLYASVPIVGAISIVSILAGVSPLGFLAAFSGISAYSLADQIFAVDFFSITKDMEITKDLQGYPVVAINDGVVVDVMDGLRNTMSEEERATLKYGNYIVLEHENGKFYSLYAHLEKGSIRAKKGDMIKRGMYLGRVGHSGNSDANQPHLHFEMLYTNIMGKNKFSLLLDFPKMRNGFAPYKCTKVPFTQVAKIWIPNGNLDGVKQAFVKPMGIDRSGELNGACFLTEPTEVLESYQPTYEAAKYLNKKITFSDVQKKMYFIADTKGINHSVYEIDGEKYRVRVETIVRRKIKGQDTVFFEKRDEVSHYGSTYKIPGGSTEPKLTMAQQAEAECNEEILVNVKNVHYTGKYYIVKYDEKTIPEWHKKILWPMGCKYVGAITFVFSADYAGPYRKEVAKEDRDSLVKKGDWYPIEDFEARAIKFHKGINLKISNESMTHFITESSPGYVEPETIFDEPETFSYGADEAILELQNFVDRNGDPDCKFKILKIGISTCIGTVYVPKDGIINAIRFCRKATNSSNRFSYYIAGRTDNDCELLLHFNPKKKTSVDDDFSMI